VTTGAAHAIGTNTTAYEVDDSDNQGVQRRTTT